jgi:hypothetical protein
LNWFCPVETGFRWLQPEKSRNSQSRLLNSFGRKKKNFKLSCLHYIKYDYNFRLVKSFIGLLQRHNGLRKYQDLKTLNLFFFVGFYHLKNYVLLNLVIAIQIHALRVPRTLFYF